MTIIELARQRLEAAEHIHEDFTGEVSEKGGISLETIGDFIVIDDGYDRWLARKEGYSDGIEVVIGELLDGAYDGYLDKKGLHGLPYSELCNQVPCIYSCYSPCELSVFEEAILDPDIRTRIIEALEIEEEYAEYLESKEAAQ